MSKMMYMDNQYAGVSPYDPRLYPVGKIDMYAGVTAPDGWLLCDGSAVDRTTYAELFRIIGTTYGIGDGSTTFNLPNMQGRVPVGVGTESSVTYSLGGTGGNKDAIVPYHNHTASNGKVTDKAAFNTNNSGSCSISSSGAHVHAGYNNNSSGSYSDRWGPSHDYSRKAAGVELNPSNGAHTHSVPNHTHSIPAHGHGFTQPTISYAGSEGNVTNANMMPYVAVNYIIYAGV